MEKINKAVKVTLIYILVYCEKKRKKKAFFFKNWGQFKYKMEKGNIFLTLQIIRISI